jgi:hypothetical protein
MQRLPIRIPTAEERYNEKLALISRFAHVPESVVRALHRSYMRIGRAKYYDGNDGKLTRKHAHRGHDGMRRRALDELRRTMLEILGGPFEEDVRLWNPGLREHAHADRAWSLINELVEAYDARREHDDKCSPMLIARVIFDRMSESDRRNYYREQFFGEHPFKGITFPSFDHLHLAEILDALESLLYPNAAE